MDRETMCLYANMFLELVDISIQRRGYLTFDEIEDYQKALPFGNCVSKCALTDGFDPNCSEYITPTIRKRKDPDFKEPY